MPLNTPPKTRTHLYIQRRILGCHLSYHLLAPHASRTTYNTTNPSIRVFAWRNNFARRVIQTSIPLLLCPWSVEPPTHFPPHPRRMCDTMVWMGHKNKGASPPHRVVCCSIAWYIEYYMCIYSTHLDCGGHDTTMTGERAIFESKIYRLRGRRAQFIRSTRCSRARLAAETSDARPGGGCGFHDIEPLYQPEQRFSTNAKKMREHTANIT